MKTNSLTLDEAEKIRKALGLDFEEFSIRLDYSHPAYRLAVQRGRITPRMATEIRRRFWRYLESRP